MEHANANNDGKHVHDSHSHHEHEMHHHAMNEGHDMHSHTRVTHDHMNHTGHEGHDHAGGHLGHMSHMGNLKQKFWISLIITIPIILLSTFMGERLPLQFSFPGSDWVVLVLSSVLF
ncbi:MAG: copper-translocating P-type ATPase, partial [Bacteroidia bacterium]|nr:copper-translocating P-type ATPase [Bacteroidia bacterium]